MLRVTAELFRRCARGQCRIRDQSVLAVVVSVALATTGCLSNRYALSTGDLMREASLPPGQRGHGLRVVQQFGAREGTEVVPTDTWSSGQGPGIDMHLDGAGYGSGARVSGGRPPGPAPRSTGGGGGSVSLSSGGGNGGDGLAVLAIVIVAVAVLAAAGLAVTEGIRYDGIVDLHPYQPVHIKARDGWSGTVPLAEISPALAAATSSAEVLDNEGPGIRFVHRRPLDRAGWAFKVDLGGLSTFDFGYGMAGMGSNVQLGYFPHHRFGILGSLSLGGGTDAVQRSFQRHSANMEAQFFPASWGRLHAGVFLHAGQQVAVDADGTRSGVAVGGGGIVELALTTRLALSVRGDYTRARTGVVSGSWADNMMYTAGVAIY